MDTGTKQNFLTALDAALEPIGFKRPKTQYEWKRKTGKNVLEWVHLNFGLGIINPSLGVTFLDLKRALPEGSGAVFSASRMLSTITGRNYSEATPQKLLVTDVVTAIQEEIPRLSDHNHLIKALSDGAPRSWPVWSLSHRNRLLPLLMANAGDADGARRVGEELVQEYSKKDQLRPSLGIYMQLLFETYNA